MGTTHSGGWPTALHWLHQLPQPLLPVRRNELGARAMAHQLLLPQFGQLAAQPQRLGQLPCLQHRLHKLMVFEATPPLQVVQLLPRETGWCRPCRLVTLEVPSLQELPCQFSAG